VPFQTNLSGCLIRLRAILQISSASSSSNIVRIRKKFHKLETGSMRALTIATSSKTLTCDLIRFEEEGDSHLSTHILMCSPFPTHQTSPSLISPLPEKYSSKHMKDVAQVVHAKSLQMGNISPSLSELPKNRGIGLTFNPV
jgi:hypothetical protein